MVIDSLRTKEREREREREREGGREEELHMAQTADSGHFFVNTTMHVKYVDTYKPNTQQQCNLHSWYYNSNKIIMQSE